MDVILLRPIKRKGKIGDIVAVKDGFARNYLIPQGIAQRATEANKAAVEARRHELEEKNNQAVADAQKLHKELDNKELVFVRTASNDGRLFGSIAGRDIAAELATQNNITVHNSSVLLAHPIKAVGVYEVGIELHSEVECMVLVVVAKSDAEAIEAIKVHKNGGEVVAEETPELSEDAEAIVEVADEEGDDSAA